MAKAPTGQFSEKEMQQRFEATLKGAMNAPHKPLKEKPKARPHKKAPTGQFSEKEMQQRFEAALKGAMNAPHKPLKEKPKARPHKKAMPKKREK
jgi:23S rRNA-/tRNA-specific pseudouridylate synthase